MENIVVWLIPLVPAVLLARLVLMPVKAGIKLAAHSLGGFLCLWLLNGISGFTGIAFPLNAVTVLTAGFLGLPGIGILALLELMGR